jgi:hypothetical protein
MHECSKEEVIQTIKQDLKEIKGDVKALLAVKWQIIGGSAVMGFVIYLVSLILPFLR